jgi:hypothetical protein
MIALRPDLKVVVAAHPVDFRKSVHTLSALVSEALRANPYLCVRRRYVAAPSRSEEFRGFGECCRHITSDDSPPTQDRPGRRHRGDFDVGFVFQV